MTNNPLQQYFRRPSIYITLPSEGIGYPEGSLNLPENKEIPVYPMTAIDEITAKTPDALFNGVAVCDIIRSCVPSILNPWEVKGVDIDAILVAIKIATNGSEMDIETTCPKCSEDAKFGLSLPHLLQGLSGKGYKEPLVINGMTIKFSSLAYREIVDVSLTQFKMQKTFQQLSTIDDADEKTQKQIELMRELGAISIGIIAKSIESITTSDTIVTNPEHILEFCKNVDSKVYEEIRARGVKLREDSQTRPLKMKCVSCSHEYSQQFTVNASDFFG